MKAVAFTITDEEVKDVMRGPLKREQTKGILCAVENDSVLWGDIQGSIQPEITHVSGINNEKRASIKGSRK